MPGRIDEKDVLFSTFAEITSLSSLGKDNRVIFNRILNIVNNRITLLSPTSVKVTLVGCCD